MARVKEAYVTVDDDRIWISDRRVRWQTKRGFTIYTDEATWHYDSTRNTVVISGRAPGAGWELLQRFCGGCWLPPPGCEWSAHEYTVSDDLLDGKATKRIDTDPGIGGYGATLWVDGESMRVVGLEEWRICNGTRRSTGPRIRVTYDTPMHPQLFVAKTPPGTLIVDRRTGSNPRRTPA